MATYEYVCLACERPFELSRPIGSAVATSLACPSCGSDRVRRRFSVFATGPGTPAGNSGSPAGGGCACGGACACGH